MSHYHYWFILSIVFLAVNPQDCYNEIAHKLTTDFGEVVIYSLTAHREIILQEKCQKDLRSFAEFIPSTGSEQALSEPKGSE